MNEDTNTAMQAGSRWRIKLGAALFVLSIALPLAGIALLARLGLSATMTTSLSAAALVAAELLGIAAIAVMGKPGYLYIRGIVLGFLKRHAPPREVSRTRYNVGLVMFMLPILFGWLTPYALDLVPLLQRHLFACAIGGDILLLASLFVLGGDFWDKVQALFVHNAKVFTTDTR